MSRRHFEHLLWQAFYTIYFLSEIHVHVYNAQQNIGDARKLFSADDGRVSAAQADGE
jgi:hypothetical protein